MKIPLCLMLAAAVLAIGHAESKLEVTVVPPSEVKRLDLDPFYAKYCSASGVPVVASERVDDHALLEAAYLINGMLEKRADLVRALIAGRTRVVVIGHDEFTLDGPEHGDPRPEIFWHRRARGIGSDDDQPAVSCGAENLLGYEGDPFHTENVLIREFAHTIRHQGLRRVDPTFDGRLETVFESARARGLWGTANDRDEYWAEGVQSWFDSSRGDDSGRNHVHTREELIDYDPGLSTLVEEVFGKPKWRYTKPALRANRGHLAGYDPDKAPKFAWPERLTEEFEAYQRGEAHRGAGIVDLDELDDIKSRHSLEFTFVRVQNQGDTAKLVYWIDFNGIRHQRGRIAPGDEWAQRTYTGHVWLITDEAGKPNYLLQPEREDFELAISPRRTATHETIARCEPFRPFARDREREVVRISAGVSKSVPGSIKISPGFSNSVPGSIRVMPGAASPFRTARQPN